MKSYYIANDVRFAESPALRHMAAECEKSSVDKRIIGNYNKHCKNRAAVPAGSMRLKPLKIFHPAVASIDNGAA